MHSGPASRSESFHEGHVVKKLLSHPRWQGRGLKKFVCHLMEFDNVKVCHTDPLSNGVYQYFEILHPAGWLGVQFLPTDPNPQV